MRISDWSSDVCSSDLKRLPPEILTVGIFRNESRERVVELTHQAGLRAAQLHGHESAEDSRWVRERDPVLIKVFPGGDHAIADVASSGADVVLLNQASAGWGVVLQCTLEDVGWNKLG